MECQRSDSKKITKVFEASHHKRSRKKRDRFDDSNSLATDDSTLGCRQQSCHAPSGKASMPDLSPHDTGQDDHVAKREGDSSPSQDHSPDDVHRSKPRRRHRSTPKEDLSLALNAGMVSTPRSISPLQEGDCMGVSLPKGQDSSIYAFLEEAIKMDKKKQRHARRHGDRRSHNRESSPALRDCDRDRARDRDHDHERTRHYDYDHDCERHRRHHRRRNDASSRDRDKQPKEESPAPPSNEKFLMETFAKICAQLNDKDALFNNAEVKRSQSHKSLQCEVVSNKNYEMDRQPVRLNRSRSRDLIANKVRSQENFSNKARSQEKIYTYDTERYRDGKCYHCHGKEPSKYQSKLDTSRSRTRQADEERYRDYIPMVMPTRSCIDPYRRQPEYRDYDRERRQYTDERRRYVEQKTSRSFDIHRECHDDDERIRRTARSDPKERRYEEVLKYCDERLDPRDRTNINKDRRWKKNMERYERNSIASREEDYNRERDRYSERERDSGLSVADGDTSTVSGKSNYLKVVKRQITEQREAMDKMMGLWKELMRCFKGISQTPMQDKHVQESAANVHESAAEHMRLWWECMRRYETVAKDVGDTDARLMEEIKKQRSEMAEMATMWQECLQRYRDISNDFNSLKQQLVPPEVPTRIPAPPMLSADGEDSVPPQPYRMPPGYPPQLPPPPAAMAGSPLRGRSSVPPAWWWCDNARSRLSPRRRSSPDSRASRDRDKDRRHRHKDKEEPRYKEKSGKTNAARSDHRHRKR